MPNVAQQLRSLAPDVDASMKDEAKGSPIALVGIPGNGGGNGSQTKHKIDGQPGMKSEVTYQEVLSSGTTGVAMAAGGAFIASFFSATEVVAWLVVASCGLLGVVLGRTISRQEKLQHNT